MKLGVPGGRVTLSVSKSPEAAFMSWTIEIEAEKEIDSDKMCAAIDSMPDRFLGEYRSKPPRHWGWALAIAVPNPVGNKITLNGSHGISGSWAREFANSLVSAMNAEGLNASVVWNDMDH